MPGQRCRLRTPSPSVLTLSNGAASNNAYSYLPGGTYSLTANYEGDGTFASSVSNPPIAVNISAEPSTLDLAALKFPADNSAGIAAGSVAYGTYVSVSAQPFSTAQLNSSQPQTYRLQATGTVNFISTLMRRSTNPISVISSNGIAEIPGQTSLAYPPGTYSVHGQLLRRFQLRPQHGRRADLHGHQERRLDPLRQRQRRWHHARAGRSRIGSAFFFNGGLSLPTGTVTLTDSSGATVGTGACSREHLEWPRPPRRRSR